MSSVSLFEPGLVVDQPLCFARGSEERQWSGPDADTAANYAKRGGHLPDAYHRIRKPIYHLYELINHVHLFGNDYLRPLLATAERIATFV